MDEMAFNQCKHRTIAEALGVGRENLVNNYLPRLHKKSAEGRVELRATQHEMAKNFPAMAIFLGKNTLDQADKAQITGKDGEAIQVAIVDYSKIDPDDTDTEQTV